MVVRKKRKFLKYRGHRTYGYGSHKSHRGGGSRGGRGKAGMHKHKWSYTVKYEPGRYGKRGFKPIDGRKTMSVNVSDLPKLAGSQKRVDVREFGYGKVLGKGKLERAIEVIANSFSSRAVEKIESAGGRVVIFGETEDSTENSEESSEDESIGVSE